MPIYEYSCKKCGSVVERIQKFSDPPLKRHQGCGGTLTKLISQSAFQLKGSGWYVTDYARKGNGQGTSDNGSAGEAAKTDGAGDSKGSGGEKTEAASSKEPSSEKSKKSQKGSAGEKK